MQAEAEERRKQREQQGQRHQPQGSRLSGGKEARPGVGRLQPPSPTAASGGAPSASPSPAPYDPVPVMDPATGALHILGGEIPPWDPRYTPPNGR